MHSQNLEEQYILNYFGDKAGTFLDIGANDGTTFSNTRALALKGWRGVMVEPSPRAFQKLQALYKGHKGLYTYEVAIGLFNGKATLNQSGSLVSQVDVGLVSTFHSEEMDRFKRTVDYEPVEVKVYTWKTFLNRLRIKEFDFVSIDCEGEDLNILKQMDFSKTSCVCVEWNGHEHLKKQYSEILKEFRIIYTSGENLLFAR